MNTIRAPTPQQVIGGRYRLVEPLGQGGMAMVFLAEQIGVGNKVAIKFLDPDPKDDSRVARFLREGKVALQTSHPGAAQLLDVGQDDKGYLYLVFEYVEGFDLRQLIRDEGRLGFEEARTISVKVAEVLAFAHARGIVHRDVKPENIRIRRDLAGPHVKMLDFGIARLINDVGVRLTAEGELAGTPRYMAPEQIRDSPIDARTDIYALGLVFFEMLAGRPAFEGKNLSTVLLKQVQDPVPRLAEVIPELDHPLVDNFIRKACAKNPNDRFQTMEAFVRGIQGLKVQSWSGLKLRPASQVPLGGTLVDISDTYVRPAEPTLVSRELGGAAGDSRPTSMERPAHKAAAAVLAEVVGRSGPMTAPLPPASAAPPTKPPLVPWDDERSASKKKTPDGRLIPADLRPTDPARPAVERREPKTDLNTPVDPSKAVQIAIETLPPDAPVKLDSTAAHLALAIPKRRVLPWVVVFLVALAVGLLAVAAWQRGWLPFKQ